MRAFLALAASLAAIACAGAPAHAQTTCPTSGPLHVIASANRARDGDQRHREILEGFIRAAETPNTLVVLGPDVDLDFSAMPNSRWSRFDYPLIQIAQCVRITSAANLAALPITAGNATASAVEGAAPRTTVTQSPAAGRGAERMQQDRRARGQIERGLTPPPPPRPNGPVNPDIRNAPMAPEPRPVVTPTGSPPRPGDLVVSQPGRWDASWANTIVEARGISSLGPVIRYGPSRTTSIAPFLAVFCRYGPADHVRISGFRLIGPSFGQQTRNEIGIRVYRCVDVDIGNMEIAGWGQSGVNVLDTGDLGSGPNVYEVEGQGTPTVGRIGFPVEVRIHNSYIHHNQHPQNDGDAAGYGVDISTGAWASIFENTFDSNRHAIAANGDAGGYDAQRNLVLKGGGYHGTRFNGQTHIVDVHGSEDNLLTPEGYGGRAGRRFLISENTIQYTKDTEIKIRGVPIDEAVIRNNVFANDDLSDDIRNPTGGAAIAHPDSSHIRISANIIDVDTYGDYLVCDFDGDGVDDLFQATGVTWWVSGMGEFAWSYLNTRPERSSQLRVGFFDDAPGCDVIVESGGVWSVFSGGRGRPRSLGQFGPLRDIAFGRFGTPREVSGRPVRQRAAMQAFRRTSAGEWQATTLDAPAWRVIGSSDKPFSALRFDDFTGDGLTDVLAVDGGRWSISEGGTQRWRRINETLGDGLGGLYFADLDHNGRMDVLKLDQDMTFIPALRGAPTTWRIRQRWLVSTDGTQPWVRTGPDNAFSWTGYGAPRAPVFVGDFGAGAGGGVLMIDADRKGHFFAPAESERGAAVTWTSVAEY
jgi:hypothetical protein